MYILKTSLHVYTQLHFLGENQSVYIATQLQFLTEHKSACKYTAVVSHWIQVCI